MNDLEFIHVGNVSVDSGQLSISDPGYWDDERLSYDKVLDAATNSDNAWVYTVGDLEQVDASMGLIFPTQSGDGIYKVWSVWKENNLQGYFVGTDAFGEWNE